MCTNVLILTDLIRSQETPPEVVGLVQQLILSYRCPPLFATVKPDGEHRQHCVSVLKLWYLLNQLLVCLTVDG